MNESILTSIKKVLGITEEYTHFDADLIMHINTVLGILSQLGVGPNTGFSITDKTTVWSDFLGSNASLLEMCKSYVAIKTQMLFDPPTSGILSEAKNRYISELEWRITVVIDSLGEET